MKTADSMLSEDEKVLGHTGLHWIHLVKGSLWLIVLSGLGISYDLFLSDEAFLGPDFFPYTQYPYAINNISIFEWLCIGGGLWVFLVYYLKYISTFIWVTNKRLIYKTGLILVRIRETDLQEIKEERVNQGWFGSLLDYGAVYMDCRFVQDLQLPEIEDPYSFIKVVYNAREHIGREVVIE